MLRRFRKSPFTKAGLLKEEHEQTAVIDWLRLTYPAALFTIAPNGIKLHPSVANKLSLIGYRAGTPDIMIFEPKGQYHGLFVEMKISKGGVVSPSQAAFREALLARGYQSVICAGSAAAKIAISEYMAGR